MIRQLYRSGVGIARFVKQVGRSESAVQRNSGDLFRKKLLPPKGKHATRNDRILEPVQQGISRAAIARRFRMSPSQVSIAVVNHPHIVWLLRVKKLKPATVAANSCPLPDGVVERGADRSREGARPGLMQGGMLLLTIRG